DEAVHLGPVPDEELGTGQLVDFRSLVPLHARRIEVKERAAVIVPNQNARRLAFCRGNEGVACRRLIEIAIQAEADILFHAVRARSLLVPDEARVLVGDDGPTIRFSHRTDPIHVRFGRWSETREVESNPGAVATIV